VSKVPHKKSDVLQGTLDLMILQTLDTMGRLHGWGIARRIEQVAENALYLNQGTIYPALIRLEQQGSIISEWGVSENNRRAKFFRITKGGRRQLKNEAADWWRMSGIMARLLKHSE
jgi:PadR family transcriptional regulator, regulatory protein PadR